jgi:hypothetical protein
VVTPSAFVANYPEFADALTNFPTLVSNALNDAYSMTPANIWSPALVDQGAQLRAAQILSLSNYGKNLALSDNDGITVYDKRLDRLVAITAGGGSVL